MAFKVVELVLGLLLAVPVCGLWPIPRALQTGTTPLILSKDFKITAIRNPPSDLTGAISRTLGHISDDKLQRLVVGRASADEAAVQHAKQLPSLTLSLAEGAEVKSISEEAIKPLGTRSEEYVLHVPSDGSPATLSANSTLGLLRGLTTFEQLWYDLDGAATYTLEAPISITDAPAYVSARLPNVDDSLTRSVALPRIHVRHCKELVRFVQSSKLWLMKHVDVHYSFSVSDIERTLDAMSWAKVCRPRDFTL